MIVIFREEAKGAEGLKLIRERTKTTFTLAVDFEKNSTKAYSPKRMTFHNYVISKDGTVVQKIDGDLRTRANWEQLEKALKALESPED